MITMNNLCPEHLPVSLVIDLDRLAYNVRALKKKIGSACSLMAVVKADGYGHGAVPIAQTVLENGATQLAVNLISEAAELRAAGIAAPILILGGSSFAACEQIVEQRFSVLISDESPLAALAAAAQRQNRVALVQLKVDTGMGRLGCAVADFLSLSQKVKENPWLRLEGVLSHFPLADWADKGYTRAQIQLFHSLVEQLYQADIRPEFVHIANSAAVIDLPEVPGNLVRTGIAVYGLYPSADNDRCLGLKAVLSFQCQVVFVKKVPAGTALCYGHTYTTEQDTVLAVIPVGYVHGLSRALSNLGEVLIRGVRCPIRGRVCMDSTMVEVPFDDLQAGEEVMLIGRQGTDEIKVDEWSRQLNTINYEILTSLSSRIPRLYLKHGKLAKVRHLEMIYEAV